MTGISAVCMPNNAAEESQGSFGYRKEFFCVCV